MPPPTPPGGWTSSASPGPVYQGQAGPSRSSAHQLAGHSPPTTSPADTSPPPPSLALRLSSAWEQYSTTSSIVARDLGSGQGRALSTALHWCSAVQHVGPARGSGVMARPQWQLSPTGWPLASDQVSDRHLAAALPSLAPLLGMGAVLENIVNRGQGPVAERRRGHRQVAVVLPGHCHRQCRYWAESAACRRIQRASRRRLIGAGRRSLRAGAGRCSGAGDRSSPGGRPVAAHGLLALFMDGLQGP